MLTELSCTSAPSPPTLDNEASAALRTRLMASLSHLAGLPEFDQWAQRCLPAKDTLTAGDARLVEQAFQGKLAEIDKEPDAPSIGTTRPAIFPSCS